MRHCAGTHRRSPGRRPFGLGSPPPATTTSHWAAVVNQHGEVVPERELSSVVHRRVNS